MDNAISRVVKSMSAKLVSLANGMRLKFTRDNQGQALSSRVMSCEESNKKCERGSYVNNRIYLGGFGSEGYCTSLSDLLYWGNCVELPVTKGQEEHEKEND